MISLVEFNIYTLAIFPLLFLLFSSSLRLHGQKELLPRDQPRWMIFTNLPAPSSSSHLFQYPKKEIQGRVFNGAKHLQNNLFYISIYIYNFTRLCWESQNRKPIREENNRESIQFNSINIRGQQKKKNLKKNAKGKRVEPLNKNQHHRSCPTQNLEWRNSLGVL